jgi:hypothetical protein
VALFHFENLCQQLNRGLVRNLVRKAPMAAL